MKEGIRGLRPSYKQDKPRRTSVGGAQAAIEFKFLNLNRRITRSFTLNIIVGPVGGGCLCVIRQYRLMQRVCHKDDAQWVSSIRLRFASRLIIWERQRRRHVEQHWEYDASFHPYAFA